MGGDTMGSVVRLRLWDLDCEGGGPGGGGGSGMPGSHLDWEVDLDRADVGVSIALADAALRALGGIAEYSVLVVSTLSSGRAVWIVRGGGCGCGCGCRDIEATGGWGSGGDSTAVSRSLRRLRDGSPNRRSREGPRPLAFGGGGKFWADCCGGSGDGRWTWGGTRAAEILAGGVSRPPPPTGL